VCRTLAGQICSDIHAFLPGVSTTENKIASRDGKVYLDPSQNDYADTLASVYSVRPNHQPTVSTPLERKEVNVKLGLLIAQPALIIYLKKEFKKHSTAKKIRSSWAGPDFY